MLHNRQRQPETRIMKVTADELLDMVFAAADFLSRPTLAKALGCGTTWSSGAAQRQTLWRLQRDHMLERVRRGNETGWRITAAGRQRLAALPTAPRLRERRWDGLWRLVVFDVPEVSRRQRDAFRWWLKMERMGQLQKSVWVSAYPLSEELERFLTEAAQINWVLWFESPEKGPATDAQIAQRAWPIAQVAAAYEKYLAKFEGRLSALERGVVGEPELARWRAEEWAAYDGVLQRDPFLPKRLLPPSFPGWQADRFHARFLSSVVKAAAVGGEKGL
jgi:phenylacetic acid degradation operon negative regulatory protein